MTKALFLILVVAVSLAHALTGNRWPKDADPTTGDCDDLAEPTDTHQIHLHVCNDTHAMVDYSGTKIGDGLRFENSVKGLLLMTRDESLGVLLGVFDSSLPSPSKNCGKLRVWNGTEEETIFQCVEKDTPILPKGKSRDTFYDARWRPLEDMTNSLFLKIALSAFGDAVIRFSFALHKKHPSHDHIPTFALHLYAERIAAVRHRLSTPEYRGSWKLAWEHPSEFIGCVAVLATQCPHGYGGSTLQCNNSCYGMCGPGCCCWTQICQDCYCYAGCAVHDYYCSCTGTFFNSKCLLGSGVTRGMSLTVGFSDIGGIMIGTSCTPCGSKKGGG